MVAVNPRQILIVDDNLALAENIAEILQIDGHATRVAGSAEEAFPSGREDEPDVVVTDYRLPGINGAVFVRQLLAARTRVRAMVISAYTDATTIAAATDAGATFMAKPLDFALLGRWVGAGSA
jgi:DNA-binding NtrC family response regulator